MKNKGLLVLALAGMMALSGCGAAVQNGADTPPAEQASSSQSMETLVRLRIVDGADTGELVLAGQQAGEVYTLSAKQLPVLVKGQPASPEVLQDGMEVEIQYSGEALYSFPAALNGVQSISVVSDGEDNPMPDLCGVYLETLEQLWSSDINENIQQLAVDLSRAPGGLTQGEKAAVAWAFGSRHGVQGFCATMEELEADGLLTSFAPDTELMQWEDGALFSIMAVAPRGCIVPSEAPQAEEECTSAPQSSGLTVLELDAQRWRSPRGAAFLENCLVEWDAQGSWSFTPGALAMA